MKITIDIDNEKIKGLLCCAFEGGSNYWAQIKDYKFVNGISYEDFQEGGKYQTPKDYWHPCQLVPLVEGCAVIVTDMETQTKNKKDYKLNLESIHKGLQVMALKAPKHFGDFLADNSDITTGDVFLQCCLFGEVIYG